MHRATKAILPAAFTLSTGSALTLAARMTVTAHVAAVTGEPAAVVLATVVSVLFAGTLCFTALLAVTGGSWRPRT